MAHWLSTDYADKFDEEGREQLKLLLGRAKQMHDLIEGVLRYSRVGRLREEKKEIDLNELVGEAILMVSPPENIKIEILNKLPVITGEKTRIEQIFSNLSALQKSQKVVNSLEGYITTP